MTGGPILLSGRDPIVLAASLLSWSSSSSLVCGSEGSLDIRALNAERSRSLISLRDSGSCEDETGQLFSYNDK